MFRMIKKYLNGKMSDNWFEHSWNSYKGWLKYCNSKHLLQKIKSIINVPTHCFNGAEKKITRIAKDCIYFVDLELRRKYYLIYFIFKGKPYYVKSQNKKLYWLLSNINTRNIVIKSRTSLKLIYN